MKSKTHKVSFRRRRERKTNYKKRFNLLKSSQPRLVIRKSLKNMTLQLISYDSKGDKVMASASSRELEKLGWGFNKSNCPSAYLTGLLLGKKAKEKDIKNAIIDTGLYPVMKGSKLYAAVKGAIDAGLKIPCSEEVLVKEERIKGQHITEHAKKLKADPERYKSHFANYIKKNLDPESFTKNFEEIKQKIIGGK